MNTERYYDIITNASKHLHISRREATLIVTAFCCMARNPEEHDIELYSKTIGILMGLNAAERINDMQYELLREAAIHIDTFMHDSASAYTFIERTFEDHYLDD